MPFGRGWPRRCCTATPGTPKRSPASPGAWTNTPSGSSPGKSAPAKPSRPGRDRGPGPVAARDHLPANPRSGCAACCTTSWRALGAMPRLLHRDLGTAGRRGTGRRARRTGPHSRRGVDEAHLLDNPQMEAIRMLTNHDMDSGSPFAAVLVGQPSLRHRLRLGVFAALDQRSRSATRSPG